MNHYLFSAFGVKGEKNEPFDAAHRRAGTFVVYYKAVSLFSFEQW